MSHSMVYVRTRNLLREHKKWKKMADRRQKILTSEGRHDAVPDAAREAFEEHIRTMVAIARSGGAQVILSSFATIHDTFLNYKSIESLAQLSTLQKKELVSLLDFTPGLTLPAIFDGINSYNRVLKQIADEEHTGWVDSAALVPHMDANFVDRVHFTSTGAARMADNFFPVVMKLLQL